MDPKAEAQDIHQRREGKMSKSTAANNKAIVLEAFETLFNNGDYAAAERLWSPNYIQHSAHIEPGREAKTANETLILEPSRRQLLQKRSENMRSEKAIMTSRREFLSNALGMALVTASTWPIRADQARSMHGQSDSSTPNSGRTTQN